jgi:hypothetical protein
VLEVRFEELARRRRLHHFGVLYYERRVDESLVTPTETNEGVGRGSSVPGDVVIESRSDHEFDSEIECVAGVVD